MSRLASFPSLVDNAVRKAIFCACFGFALLISTPVALSDPMNAPEQAAVGVYGEDHSSPVSPLGSYVYRFNFELPQPRGAVSTSLGLVYQSSGKDGEAGYGWGLAIPSIWRAPLTGWPEYDDERDRFVYQGRPLSFVCIVGDTKDGCGPDPMPAWAKGWRHYREKYDQSFARYFYSPDGNTWRVQKKGGTITEFGRALFAPELSGDEEATERDVLSSDNAPVFRWLPAREFDEHGGLVVYRWRRDLSGSGRRVLSDIWDTPQIDSALSLQQFAHHVYLEWEENAVKLIFDSWGRVAARKLLILLVWGTDFSKV